MVHGRCIGFHSGFKIELVSVSALYLSFIISCKKRTISKKHSTLSTKYAVLCTDSHVLAHTLLAPTDCKVTYCSKKTSFHGNKYLRLSN